MFVYVKMMSKGSKEALTVLIVTHVTHVERVEESYEQKCVCPLFQHNIIF